jgi:hypothetical protein
LYFNTDIDFTALCVSSGGGSSVGSGVVVGGGGGAVHRNLLDASQLQNHVLREQKLPDLKRYKFCCGPKIGPYALAAAC